MMYSQCRLSLSKNNRKRMRFWQRDRFVHKFHILKRVPFHPISTLSIPNLAVSYKETEFDAVGQSVTV